jgi:16S rRNA (cytosine967-C5)-methyltransferase
MGLSELAKPDGKAGLAARRSALAILSAVLGQGRPFDDALMRDHAGGLEPRDRAFVTALVQTSLRRKGECDAIVAQFLTKKLPRKSGCAALVLLMGTAQLLYLEAPPHAVIDTAVTLVREDRDARHFSGLINAVLRKVAAARPLDKPHLNVPQFLWRRWIETYGRKTAHEIAAAHAGLPPLDLTVKSDPEKWAETLNASLLPTGSLRLRDRQQAIETLPGFAEGAWWVQDAAAALPARLLSDVAGRSVLDLCAAPGGKTAQLAGAGAQVTAVDQSAARMERVQQNLDRLGLTAELQVSDVGDRHDPPPSRSAAHQERAADRRARHPTGAPARSCGDAGAIGRQPDLLHLLARARGR